MGKGEFESLMARANGRCELTGIQFTAERPATARKAVWGPSIDRIECGKPYILKNCRLVCVAVNLALNEFGLETLKIIAAGLAGTKFDAAEK